MEMVILLLLSAMAQLVTPRPTLPPNSNASLNLNHIINSVNNYNRTFAKDFFVEDVQDLRDAGCKNDFFCKVQNILSAHKKVGETKREETTLERNLNAYINSLNIDCKEELQTVKNTTVTKPITVLLDHLKDCSRQTKLLGRK